MVAAAGWALAAETLPVAVVVAAAVEMAVLQ